MKAANDHLVFFNIDTQVDFMRPTGKLAIRNAHEIVPNLAALMRWAREHDVPVISTADAHQPDDPEFAVWPPHCVVGTPGQELIPETLFPSHLVIPALPGAFHPPARWEGQFIVEKPVYSIEGNPNFTAIVSALGRRRAVVFGVATEVCVRADALALRRQGLDVDLVTDAVKPISEDGGRAAIGEMQAAGVRLVTTSEVCKLTAEAPAPGG